MAWMPQVAWAISVCGTEKTGEETGGGAQQQRWKGEGSRASDQSGSAGLEAESRAAV